MKHRFFAVVLIVASLVCAFVVGMKIGQKRVYHEAYFSQDGDVLLIELDGRVDVVYCDFE